MATFSHLHNHTQYSLLDGFSNIKKLYKKATLDGMPAISITDHGNMFGVFEFVAEAWQNTVSIGKDEFGKDILKPKVKPIVGCEFYVVEDRFKKEFNKNNKDKKYHQVLLAKNEIGYQNLSKLCSLGYLEGMYSKYPRIDKSLITQYASGLIATTCCIGAMVPQKILHSTMEEAEKELKWWYDIFGDDFYIELQRHNIPEQETINHALLQFSKKYAIPAIATNDSHYIEEKDWNAHDILLCINTGEKQATPGYDDFVNDDTFLKDRRFKFPNKEFFFKTTQQMQQLFADLPEAIENTQLIVDKVDTLNLKKNILLPAFPLPPEFKKLSNDDTENQYQYLRHLTYQGAAKRYAEITPQVQERIEMELNIISKMQFSGYFLIVADFIKAAKDLGVIVGPGRGSAGGSVIAFCIGIIGIDPIKYDLLFERFLNPERKSMPDIDTDFDDEGRAKVLDYITQKYSKNQVAHIVTFGTLAAKSSIKDVARVLDLPLNESNALAKLVPSKAKTTLHLILNTPINKKGVKKQGDEKNKSIVEVEKTTDNDKKEEKPIPTLEDMGYSSSDIENIIKLKEIAAGYDKKAVVLKMAQELEGSIKSTGVHASAIIIAPQSLLDLMPISVAKNNEMYVTQIEGKDIESAGVIKMDFLGLKTLSIIKNTTEMVRNIFNITLDTDNLPLNDELTFKLFQQGNTIGVFQFESPGMQKYLIGIKPDKIDDLIALCALYRPGPMAYIDKYINRKFGREQVVYDLPIMKNILESTYGIVIYQEQVMLLSKLLANFTGAEADDLRKAMGKKDKEAMKKKEAYFLEKCIQNNYPEDIIKKIWHDWEAFAEYAFNKSHSVIYAIVAYQTAYLKANYTAAFMAASLNNASNIEAISFILEDCNRNNIRFFGPDINESNKGFTINKNNEIRFGLGGIKGVGEAAIETIITERNTNGEFKDIYNFFERLKGDKSINKKSIESLIYSGSFDSFNIMHRAMFFYKKDREKKTNIEKIIDYVDAVYKTEESNKSSLFANVSVTKQVELPSFSECDPWDNLTQINYEKEVTGMYFSGHPLDNFKYILQHCNFTTLHIFNQQKQIFSGTYNNESETEQENNDNNLENLKNEVQPIINLNSKIKIAGLVTNVQLKITKNNRNYITFDLEDYSSKTNIALFGRQYTNFKNYIDNNHKIFIQGSFANNTYNENIEFNILNIDMLENYYDNIRTLELSIENKNITKDLISMLKKYCNKKGKVSLKINIQDLEEDILISLVRLERIKLDDELLNSLNKEKDIHLKLKFNNS